ncbi:MAG: c-type cytochrome [Burkholderiales bacterium]|nr:c-type cytochrome [Burkholderiales bacterium]
MDPKLPVLAAALALFAAPLAQADEALLKKHNCIACHMVDKKAVGPSYKEIAAKYRGQNVAAKLEEKVKKGGKGVWGPVEMPANPAVPDPDIKAMVAWILNLK